MSESPKPRIVNRRLLIAGASLLGGMFVVMVGILWGDDIMRHNLDPKVPFQTYRPPAAPDYSKAAAWYLNPALNGFEVRRNRNPQKVDVFFIHATSFNGGKDWVGPIDDPAASTEVMRNQLPNYAGPFNAIGYVYAPRYRQASLYSQLTQREDAREARQFAYGDIAMAFEAFLAQRRNGNGFVIVGLEQGAFLGHRLLKERILTDERLKPALVAAYFLESLTPADDFQAGQAVSACQQRAQYGCAIAYLSVDNGRPDRALQAQRRAMDWSPTSIMEPLDGKALCVNPLTGGVTDKEVEARHSLGAANATGLEWGTTPALIPRKVSARCRGDILYVSRPSGPSFDIDGSWADNKKVRPYNLFYADLQADVQARWFAWRGAQGD
ncbi:DUF3089 domain-containing protein [Asticcacaulis sp. DW145]|uniref:DUF3089 domain-containing protein n=1 Tax=Asticcacaulis currens TaxID=2984210 RepID=A0ABT5IGR2_9CAUL|nr:DUF3089 domain-containing protein [Asticcacaulis currens]MDC7695393.1 DUF3089 domain-containing protein [Asticcacaulis currens]BEV12394.1 DUF3089 domain-containing protein [Asticcacaulis sp. DW145]